MLRILLNRKTSLPLVNAFHYTQTMNCKGITPHVDKKETNTYQEVWQCRVEVGTATTAAALHLLNVSQTPRS